MNELTICSVYHSSASKRFLELNRDLTEALNTRKDWSWLVADNTPDDFKDHVDPKRFQVVRATSFDNFVKTLEPWQQAYRASLHHASAVNISLSHVKTRFALILDSDFYIVRHEWIEGVLTHMKKNNIALLGVPWHPRWWKKVRYFPAHHALFIDSALIPLSELDFRPQYGSAEEARKISYTGEDSEENFVERKGILPILRDSFTARHAIGTSKDTSYALYKKYFHGRVRVETLTPVFKRQFNTGILKTVVKKIIEFLLPDRLSYIPRKGTYTTTSFKDLGYFDAGSQGWEEFFWQGKPFGFHVRGQPGGAKRNKEEELRILEVGLQFFKRNPV